LEKRKSPEKCPECGSSNRVYDYDTGETVCGDCGLVLGQMMDEGPEWRAFTDEEKDERSRVGMPITLAVHDKGLSTTIGGPFGIDEDAFGRKLTLETKFQMRRLRKWQIRSSVLKSVDRNLARAMTELDRLADKLLIPYNLREKAAVIYRKTLEKGLVRGRSITAMISACLYAACREAGIPRTLQEIAEASLVDKKEVARCYRYIVKELEKQMPIVSPVSWVSKIAEKIGICQKTQGLAIKILRQAKERGMNSGKGPRGLAAAALYIACVENNEQKKGRFGSMEPVTQKDIADKAGVTEVTVRNIYKVLKKNLGIELP
jgi:transcription initiation factor TFIIB